MAIDTLKLPGRYYRFDKGKWSFIMLDSIYGSYVGQIDDEQMEWLKSELNKIPKTNHICVCSHIPILSASAYFLGDRYKLTGWNVPGSWMHLDALKLKTLFAKHDNVKICLSGHMHQVDRIDYQGTSYLCSGAVSGKWWDGVYYDCDCGYSIIDLYDDGSFEHAYLNYGWTAKS